MMDEYIIPDEITLCAHDMGNPLEERKSVSSSGLIFLLVINLAGCPTNHLNEIVNAIYNITQFFYI